MLVSFERASLIETVSILWTYFCSVLHVSLICSSEKCCRTAGANVASGVDTAINAVVAAIDSVTTIK